MQRRQSEGRKYLPSLRLPFTIPSLPSAKRGGKKRRRTRCTRTTTNRPFTTRRMTTSTSNNRNILLIISTSTCLISSPLARGMRDGDVGKEMNSFGMFRARRRGVALLELLLVVLGLPRTAPVMFANPCRGFSCDGFPTFIPLQLFLPLRSWNTTPIPPELNNVRRRRMRNEKHDPA